MKPNLNKAGRKFWVTSDLNLASLLRCRGFRIVDLCSENDRTVFVFEDSAELRQAILDYANDGPVGVRSFCNTLRDLKALTRDGSSRKVSATGAQS